MEQVNPVFLSMYDYKDEADVLGKSLLELHVDGKRDDNSSVMKRFVESEYSLSNFETVEVDRTGNKKFFSNNTVGIIQDGFLNSIWGTQNDITKNKEAEFELIEAKFRAEESDQLKSAFLANMSHEIRTPLNGILGFAELLDDDDLQKKDRRKFIKIIHNNSNQLLQIISDILDISKIETKQLLINKSPFSLNELMDEISLYLKNSVNKLGKEIEIVTIKELPQDEDWVVSDRIRVNQVITNLANNAVKFTKEGTVTIGYEIIKRKLRFFVRDSGKGIPAEKQADVFDRFSQVDPTSIRKYGGAGLGLPISKGIVELLKGKIGFNSELDKGSEFYFHIPLKRP